MMFTLSSQASGSSLERQRVRADSSAGQVQNDDLEHVSHYDSVTACSLRCLLHMREQHKVPCAVTLSHLH